MWTKARDDLQEPRQSREPGMSAEVAVALRPQACDDQARHGSDCVLNKVNSNHSPKMNGSSICCYAALLLFSARLGSLPRLLILGVGPSHHLQTLHLHCGLRRLRTRNLTVVALVLHVARTGWEQLTFQALSRNATLPETDRNPSLE